MLDDAGHVIRDGFTSNEAAWQWVDNQEGKPASDLIGRAGETTTPCKRCYGTSATLGAGRGPHSASLLCACGAHLGWLPKAAFDFITNTVTRFGADPSSPIILRGALDHAEEVKAMAADKRFDDTNRGVLFRDDKKSKDGDRDYSGSINVGGTEYWLSAWIKTSKAGRKFMSLSVKPKNETAVTNGKSRSEDMNDSVGF